MGAQAGAEIPTLSLCGCPSGCVVLRFGCVTVHLQRAVFLAFARAVVATARALERATPPLPTEH
jgi:hypothetical protein